MPQYSQDYHFQYLEVHRHWSPDSEPYAGGDCLVTKLSDGWSLDGDGVYYEEYWHAGTRQVTIYHFQIRRGEEVLTMPVLSNPYVRRMLKMLRTQLRPVEELEIARRRQRRIQE